MTWEELGLSLADGLRAACGDLWRRMTGGLPLALERWIDDDASRANAIIIDPPRETCAADDRIAWHQWRDLHAQEWRRTKSGQIVGWRPGPDGYSRHDLHIEALEHLTRERIIDDWTCDINAVAGVSGSKSPLSKYDSLDAMIQACRPELVAAQDPACIYHLLTHDGLRILDIEDRREKDFFTLHQWDGRIFLSNLDGSHHFSAARYLAGRFDVRVPLRGRLYCRWIDAQAVEALVGAYTLFAIDARSIVLEMLHEALGAYRVPYLRHRLPKGLSTSADDQNAMIEVLFLPRSDARSRRIAGAMATAGFFDVGAHLEGLVRRQARPGEWRAPVDRHGTWEARGEERDRPSAA